MKYAITLALSLVLASFLSISEVMAGDWPQWRGVNRDGVSTETGLRQDWPMDLM